MPVTTSESLLVSPLDSPTGDIEIYINESSILIQTADFAIPTFWIELSKDDWDKINEFVQSKFK